MTRKRTAGFIIASTVVAAVLWLAVWNTGKTQSAQVKRIGLTPQYSSGYSDVFNSDFYLWLNSRELLHFNNDYSIQYPIATYDVTTHRDTAAVGLGAVLAGHVISASPDGQWVLWNTQTFSSSPPGMAATRRADGKIVLWPHLQTWQSTGFWLPDSRRWVCVNFVLTGQMINGHPVAEKRLVVYDVNRPGTRSFAIPGDTGVENILGVTPQGKVIFNDSFDQWGGPPGQPQPPLSLREVSLKGPQPTARTFQVQVPKTPPGEGARVSLSPQGDRLLWTCFSARPNSFLLWFSSLTHRSFSGGRESLDIWTCPLNGSAPSHVGTWNRPRMGFIACWNPDGKHVSMTMDGELYSVSVP